MAGRMCKRTVLMKFVIRNLDIEPPGAQIIFSSGVSSAISLEEVTMPSIDIVRIVDVDELYTGRSWLEIISEWIEGHLKHDKRNYVSLVIARFHAATIMALIVTSTGVKSAMLSGLQYMVLVIPIPHPTKIPTGPLKLSIQPGKGSFMVEMTIDGRKQTTGSMVLWSLIICSLRCFVNV